jgi:hypothetical protein
VAAPIHLCTREAEWLTSRSARSIPSQRQTGNFRFHRPVVYFLSLRCYINRQTQRYSCNIFILYSALLHVSAVHISHNQVGIGSQK